MKIVRAEKKIVCPTEENQQGRKKNRLPCKKNCQPCRFQALISILSNG
jgi:hypothetical protein